MADSPRDRWTAPAAWLGGLLYAGWALAFAVTGRLSDDGLHAYAARELLRGRELYADFQYHQAPLLPQALAGWFRLTGVSMLSAKLFGAGIAVAVLIAAVALARRHGADRRGVALLLLAAGACPSLPLHLGYVQSQGLATLCGLLALLAAPREPGRAGRALLAGGLLGLAVAARISFVVLLVPLVLELRPAGRGAVAAAVAGCAATIAALFGPHLGELGEALYLPFGAAGGGVTRRFTELYLAETSYVGAITRRLSGWPNQLHYYAPIWLWLVVIARGERPAARPILWAALLLTVAHGVLPQRINHSYLAVAMPFWLAWSAGRPPRWTPALVVLALACAVGASWRGPARLDLSGGRTVASEWRLVGDGIARKVEPDEPILTFCVEFAVAADRDVQPGCESGYFCFYPNMTNAEAGELGVLNTGLLIDLLRQRRPRWLLLHDDAFFPLAEPRVDWPDAHAFWRLIAAGYRPVQQWDQVGETRAGLTLFGRDEELEFPSATDEPKER